jgi:excisionase family DNA binding protein
MHSQERMTDKALLSYAEAQDYTGLSERWLRKAVRADLLKPAKFGSRRLFRRTALDALIERAENEGVTLDSLAGTKPGSQGESAVRPTAKQRGTRSEAPA